MNLQISYGVKVPLAIFYDYLRSVKYIGYAEGTNAAYEQYAIKLKVIHSSPGASVSEFIPLILHNTAN
jgi:hypothetical protein